jgi:hypothetical protein
MPEEKITCDDLPVSSIFTFKASNSKTYIVQSGAAPLGHYFKIFEAGKLIKIKFMRWAIPPDYTAAKELLEIFLNE